jgi:hypothetical protein
VNGTHRFVGMTLSNRRAPAVGLQPDVSRPRSGAAFFHDRNTWRTMAAVQASKDRPATGALGARVLAWFCACVICALVGRKAPRLAGY